MLPVGTTLFWDRDPEMVPLPDPVPKRLEVKKDDWEVGVGTTAPVPLLGGNLAGVPLRLLVGPPGELSELPDENIEG